MASHEVPAEGYGRLLPNPPSLTASDFEGWLFLGLTALLVAAGVVWAVRKAIGQRDYLPVLALGSGLLTCFNEPLYDLAGHVRWAENLPGPAFTNFGIEIPMMIPPSYAIFMGLEAYWVWLIIQRGVQPRTFMMVFAAIAASDAAFEHPGVIMGVWEYYGTQPLEFYKFPFYWSLLNGAGICTIGVALHFTWSFVQDRGWLRLTVLPVGGIAFTATVFGTGFPTFLAINADMATWVQWAIGSLAVPLTIGWMYVCANLIAKPSAVPWTFWALVRTRMMLPAQRERHIQGLNATPALARDE